MAVSCCLSSAAETAGSCYGTRVDVLFMDVVQVHLPTRLDGLVSRATDAAEQQRVSEMLGPGASAESLLLNREEIR